VIFHDTTLRAMALAPPRDFEAMTDLPGVGAAKLSRYGQAFLDVIRATV
jgi:ATP-dependent DNA helicase RecQ